jgi:hypothetical protein
MTIKDKLVKVRELVEDGIMIDGEHHKQWALVEIGKIIGIDIEVEDEGIAL